MAAAQPAAGSAPIDVLVVGGGNAALCAALTARETGASVMLLEASPRDWRGGDSQHTRNLRCMHDAPEDVPSTCRAGSHGESCNDEDDAFSNARRRFHHLAFYGFLSCFAATCVATLYHYALALPAPYPATSLPKILGIAGGIALVIGTIGLFALNLRRHPRQLVVARRPMDLGLIALLLLVAASGLVLTALRPTAAMPLVLALHLGAVMALVLTLPYGKFAHGIYRSAALLKWAIERRRPPKLRLADD